MTTQTLPVPARTLPLAVNLLGTTFLASLLGMITGHLAVPILTAGVALLADWHHAQKEQVHSCEILAKRGMACLGGFLALVGLVSLGLGWKPLLLLTGIALWEQQWHRAAHIRDWQGPAGWDGEEKEPPTGAPMWACWGLAIAVVAAKYMAEDISGL